MPKSVRYVTKLVDISGVDLEGVLEMRPDKSENDYWGWHVGDDDLDTWLTKFDGKRVKLTIQTFEKDESHLLPDNG